MISSAALPKILPARSIQSRTSMSNGDSALALLAGRERVQRRQDGVRARRTAHLLRRDTATGASSIGGSPTRASVVASRNQQASDPAPPRTTAGAARSINTLLQQSSSVSFCANLGRSRDTALLPASASGSLKKYPRHAAGRGGLSDTPHNGSLCGAGCHTLRSPLANNSSSAFAGHFPLIPAILRLPRGHSSVGRASASQAECRGFESLCPLFRSKTQTSFALLTARRATDPPCSSATRA